MVFELARGKTGRAAPSCLAFIAASALLFAAEDLQARPAFDGAFPKHVFSSEEHCPSQDIHSESEPTLLTTEGLEALEYNCEFVEIRSVYDGRGWLIDAVCNEPGFFFPQQMVVMAEVNDGRGPSVLRMSDDRGPDSQEYKFYRCPAQR